MLKCFLCRADSLWVPFTRLCRVFQGSPLVQLLSSTLGPTQVPLLY